MSEEYSKSNISLSKIAKLKNSDGWKKWRTAIDEWLVDNDFDLDAPEVPEALGRNPLAEARVEHRVATKQYKKDLAAYNRKQLKGVNNIKSVCEDRGKNCIEHILTVEAAIDVLEEEFKPKGDASFQEIHIKWSNLTLMGCKDVDDYVDQFDDIYTELRSLKSANYSLPRIELVMKFIHGLGPAFSTWNQSFNISHSIVDENGISLSEVQGLVRVEEQRLNRENITAMAAFRGTSNHGSRGAPQQSRKRERVDTGKWCWKCQSEFHDNETCFILHPEKEDEWRRLNPERAAARDQRKKAQATKNGHRMIASIKATAALPKQDSPPPPPPSTRFAGLAIQRFKF
jgi:hypothetical protein